jgi:RNA polymerase sigma-70 factor, ECF subfamily
MTDLEKNLLDEIGKGDIKSFELVFKSYYPRLCKYAKSMIHDYDASSDIVKDVFIHWWENRTRTVIVSTISGYLYKSVYYSCINYNNRVAKDKSTIYESDLTGSLSELISPIFSDSPLMDMVMQELHEAIEAAIDSLPDQCRTIFILSRVEQKSHAEIAEKLGISQNTVKVQIYRALLKLKEDLKEFLPVLMLLLR